jgi:hypothetical protein
MLTATPAHQSTRDPTLASEVQRHAGAAKSWLASQGSAEPEFSFANLPATALRDQQLEIGLIVDAEKSP